MQATLPEVLPATGAASLAWLLVALPALGALVLFVAGRRSDRWGHVLGVLTIAAAFVVGLVIFIETLGLPAAQRTRELVVYDWFSVAGLHVDFGLRLDPLTMPRAGHRIERQPFEALIELLERRPHVARRQVPVLQITRRRHGLPEPRT